MLLSLPNPNDLQLIRCKHHRLSITRSLSVKILGVLMDTRFKYKEHIARAASKGLEAVIEL